MSVGLVKKKTFFTLQDTMCGHNRLLEEKGGGWGADLQEIFTLYIYEGGNSDTMGTANLMSQFYAQDFH